MPTTRTTLAVLAVAGTFALLFGETIAGLVADWWGNEEYGHAFLLLPVAAWMAWNRRTDEGGPARVTGLLVLAAAVGLFLVGVVAAEFFTRRLAAVVALGGLAVYYAGWQQLRAWWLPFGLLLFTIPLPEVVLNSLTLRLQLLASQVAVAALEFRHIPVALSGNIIELPGTELFVAEACSGLRSLSALLGLTLLMAGTGLASAPGRATLLVLAVPAAVAANIGRIFVTGCLAFYVGPDVVEGPLHTAAGIAVFLVTLGGVAALILPLRRLEEARGWGAAEIDGRSPGGGPGGGSGGGHGGGGAAGRLRPRQAGA